MLQRQNRRSTKRIALDQVGFIPWSALSNGLRIVGGSGSGKTVFASWIAWLLFFNGRANILFDPAGSLIVAFLGRVLEHCRRQGLNDKEQEKVFNRITYCDFGQSGYIVPFSLFRRFGDEPLATVADRVMAYFSLNQAESRTASIQGYNAVAKVLRPVSIILAALQPEIQITEVPDLLRHIKKEHWQARLRQTERAYPQQTAEALRFLRDEFSKWGGQEKERRIDLLESFLAPYRYSPTFRATFGASQPGLDYAQIAEQGQTVLIDASSLEGDAKQLMLNWALLFDSAGYLRWRGSGVGPPIGITVDEIASYYLDSPAAMDIFAQHFSDIVHRVRRQFGIQPLTVISQSAAQLHPKMAADLNALGNQIVGKPADFESAQMLVDQLFDYQPMLKYWEPIYFSNQHRQAEVIDHRPVEYSQDEIRVLIAQALMKLKTHRFLARLTTAEGSGQTELKQLNTEPLLGAYPVRAEIEELKQHLAARSGLPIQQVLAEVEQRLQAPIQSDIVATTPAQYDAKGYRLSHD